MGKSLRDRFEEDYTAVLEPGAGGKEKVRYVYSAPWYIWDLPEKELKRRKVELVGLCMLDFVLFLLVGTRSVEINAYSVLSLIGSVGLAAYVFVLFSCWRFLFTKYKETRMTYEYVNTMLRVSTSIFCAIMCATALVGLGYIVIVSFSVQSLFVAIGFLVCGGIAYRIQARYCVIEMYTEKNIALDNRDS